MRKDCLHCVYWIKREGRCYILNSNPTRKRFKPRGGQLNHHAVKA